MLDQFIRRNTAVQYFRFTWVDYSGVVHAKVVTKARSLLVASNQHHVYLAQNCLIVPISIAPSCSPEGPQRWELRPDWSSLRVCGFKNNHAVVMCYVEQLVPKPVDTLYKCPRTALGNALQRWEGGRDILVGFGIEFMLLGHDLNLLPGLDQPTAYANLAGLRGETLAILDKICTALERSRIEIYGFHCDIANRLKISLAPAKPMESIDQLLLAQETIRSIAVAHNMKATMFPQAVFPCPNDEYHMHLSLDPLPPHPDSFIAGILENINALCAFGMPSYDSYVRVTDDCPGRFIGWGTENRDLPIRRIEDNHWEFRFCDATANLYLFVAALLAAGLQGMDNKTPLTFKDCMVFQKELTSERLTEHGMGERMPTSLRSTIDAAKKNEGLERCLGKTLLTEYIKVKELELTKFQGTREEQRRRKYLLFF